MGVLDHTDHLRHVQTWDGLQYQMMEPKEAKAKEKAGLIQICTNLQAKDLKHPEEFDAAREAYNTAATLPPGVEDAPKKKKPATRKKRTYKTRQLKADTDGAA